jgi:uncharacterized membrane protein YphA (DoxX/SURF4 family)
MLSDALSAIQVVLFLVFVAAGTSKFLNPSGFHSAIDTAHLPTSVEALAVFLVPAAELVIALGVVLVPRTTLFLPMLAAVLLITVFTCWMLWVLRSGLRITCGCFGLDAGYVSGATVVRNLLLLTLAAAGGCISVLASSNIPTASFASIVAVSSLEATAVLAAAARRSLPGLELTLSPKP